MKNFIDGIKKGLGQGIGLLVILGIFGIVYATIGNTWTDPQELESSSGSMLTSSNWNKMLANMNSLESRMNNFSFSGGNVGIGVTPSNKLEILGSFKLRGIINQSTTPKSLGLNINASTGGAATLVLCSSNFSTANNTYAAVYLIRSGHDTNYYSKYYLGGNSDFVTFSIDGSGNLYFVGSSGNSQCSLIKTSI